MKNTDHHQLWRDALDDSLPAGFSAAALTQMLGAARSRRRRKAAVKGAIAAALVIPALFLALRPAPQLQVTRPIEEAHREIPSPTPPSPPPIQAMSDDELLAQFPGRAVAIIGSGDSKQLVFLDR
ncbi:hypothetical protein [Luteolibacter sp. Populi]|uniref:hypothetical protein n=1 Tax=Luteolibacter sp. Populi TaxID=3230487 RepID=UPI003466B3B3